MRSESIAGPGQVLSCEALARILDFIMSKMKILARILSGRAALSFEKRSL